VRTEAGAESAIDIEIALIEDWPGTPGRATCAKLRNVVRTMLALRSANDLTLADFNESWLAGATRTEEPTVESGSRSKQTWRTC